MQKLSSLKVLTHYDPSLPIQMAGDASAYGLGAVIAHVFPDSSECSVAFASRTLTSSEKNYEHVEKEAISLIVGVKHFHSYLYGWKFILVTDHNPLLAILSSNNGIPTLAAARLQRWAWIMMAYHYVIQFRPTGQHANADSFFLWLPLHKIPMEYTDSDSMLFNMSQIEALSVPAVTGSKLVLTEVYWYIKNQWPMKIPVWLCPYSDQGHELIVEGCVL